MHFWVQKRLEFEAIKVKGNSGNLDHTQVTRHKHDDQIMVNKAASLWAIQSMFYLYTLEVPVLGPLHQTERPLSANAE